MDYEKEAIKKFIEELKKELAYYIRQWASYAGDGKHNYSLEKTREKTERTFALIDKLRIEFLD